MKTRTLTLFIATAIALIGCDVFDKSLYLAREGGTEPPLSDTCAGELPMAQSSPDAVTIDTTSLSDDIREVGSCTGQPAPGADGFFGVSMLAGEKWHFHVRSTTDGRNPALYVLGAACDVRTCETGDAIDRCETGSDEHLSFVAPADGIYRVAIDDRNEGGGVYSLVALRPTCGNGGMPEHSETCDDGNTDSGDGCDAVCRQELAAGGIIAEREPNDDASGANVVRIGAGESLTVTGSVGGRCDIDLYVVDVPAGGASLRVTMLNRSGEPCVVGTAPIEMVMWEREGRTAVGDGSVRAGNACPVIDDMHAFAQSLPAGEHIVSVSMAETERPFDYRLRFELVTM